MHKLLPLARLTTPAVLRQPLKIVPGRIQYLAISKALNTLFGEALLEGELEFATGKQININISDLEISFSVSVRDGKLRVSRPSSRPDLAIHGDVYAFLLLGTRSEDADTLFFRQQIKSQGDTELGLFVKNFLDGLELNTLPAHKMLDFLMARALRIAQSRHPELQTA